MPKQNLTPDKAERLVFSLQTMAILSKCLVFESMNEMDVKMPIPNLNNFCKRIISDTGAIQAELQRIGKINMVNSDRLDEYSAQIYRVVTALAGLDIKLITEFADYLKETFEKIEQ